ncbi:MAG: hypothetical protein IH623_06815 [Verrucomicrobia bacterium]|nr:hypothetical protein [Verrucomicrobiota bacterium]
MVTHIIGLDGEVVLVTTRSVSNQIAADRRASVWGKNPPWNLLGTGQLMPRRARAKAETTDWRTFEFPQYPAEGPKLNSILDKDVPGKYTLTDHLWN